MRNYIVRLAYYIFFAIGVLALGYVCFVFADSRTYEALELKKFKETIPRLEPGTLVEGDIIGEV